MNVDVIIVGQGIAGTCLALSCIEQGMSILVIDDQTLSSSSRLSAGMFTPIFGKRLTLSWQVSELFPFALAFYKTYEKRFNQTFLYHHKTARLFTDTSEVDYFNKRKRDTQYSSFIGEDIDPGSFQQFKAEFGGFFINSSGNSFLKTLVNNLFPKSTPPPSSPNWQTPTTCSPSPAR